MARKFLADNRHLRRRWVVGLVEIAPGNQPRSQRGEETRPYLVEHRVVIPLVPALIPVRLNAVIAVAARIDSNLRKAHIRYPRNGRQPVPHARVERYQAGVFVAAIVRVHVHHQQPFAAHTRIEAPQLSKAEGKQAGGRHQHERKRDLNRHRHPPRQPAPRRRGYAPRYLRQAGRRVEARGTPGGQQARNQRRGHRNARHKPQHGCVQRQDQPRRLAAPDPDERGQRVGGRSIHRQPQRAAGRRNDRRLRHQLPHDAPPAGPDGHPHRQLFLPFSGPRKLQPHHVHARQQQPHGHHQEDHSQRLGEPLPQPRKPFG